MTQVISVTMTSTVPSSRKLNAFASRIGECPSVPHLNFSTFQDEAKIAQPTSMTATRIQLRVVNFWAPIELGDRALAAPSSG